MLRLKTVFAQNKLLARAVFEVAESLRRKGQPDKAVDLFLSIPREYPADPMALWAFKDACVIGIEQAGPDTDVRIAELQKGFAADKRLPQALCEVGDAWRKAGNVDRCVQTFQQIIQRFPEDVFAMWSQKNLVTLAIEQKQTAQADESFQRLVAQYGRLPELARAVCDIADAARTAGDPARSRLACDFVIDRFPMTTDSLWARQKLIVLDIDESEKTNTTPDVPADILASVDQLIADYDGYNDLPTAVFLSGEEFFRRGMEDCQCQPKPGQDDKWSKSIEVWRRIVEGKLPYHPTFTPHAWLFTAVCYSRIRDDAAALPYLQKVLSDWPGYEYAWNAQFWLGDCYDRLSQTNKMPIEEALPLAEAAYTNLIDRYPECCMIEHAYWRMGSMNFRAQRWDKAAMNYELFLSRGMEDGRTPEVMYRLGMAFEQLGELAAAGDIYRRLETDTKYPKYAEMAQSRLQMMGGKGQ